MVDIIMSFFTSDSFKTLCLMFLMLLSTGSWRLGQVHHLDNPAQPCFLFHFFLFFFPFYFPPLCPLILKKKKKWIRNKGLRRQARNWEKIFAKDLFKIYKEFLK